MSLIALSGKVTIAAAMLILTLINIVGADYLYGAILGPIVRDRLQILLMAVLLSVVLATKGSKLSTLKTSATSGWMQFSIGAAATVLGVFALSMFIIPSGALVSLTEPLAASTIPIMSGILITILIAYNEELVFRDVLPNGVFAAMKQKIAWLKISDWISVILFGTFHVFVLLVSKPNITSMELLTSIGLLTLLGFTWTLVRDRIGLMGAVGSHFIWNLRAVGVI